MTNLSSDPLKTIIAFKEIPNVVQETLNLDSVMKEKYLETCTMMDLLVKKAISLVLLMSVLMGTALMVPQKTQAADPITWAVNGAYEATIGKLFGALGDKVEGVLTGALDNVAGVTTGAAPVNDATTHAGQRSQVSNEKKTECERFVADVALANFEKTAFKHNDG